ncbi:restriction endonuclease subunit S [Klebsiella pneumoniae]|uniref:restriction endonuclease subunit S n=1 Tax=Klebsiella pneumoniae TaxID=573 RepID=UPI00202F4916|nr:restriction endonuclease subunit S [Klebsiella pneumoniae]MCM0764433.1 restriction endonuclease subunit S [Klebsiella pneumoniae]MCM0769984.1 restriction endonuclease subunit S [Klebsiella pneumoniae]MCM0777149.1 restriction endonuclease subunit S [Klebsiella pneumoniae]MCM0899902.1 restriction endonuclease subunit S [Klebsiella pneumoniae]MDX8168786.1 restriction endonuclease subunit S [Klebsiella pneumoniae]
MVPKLRFKEYTDKWTLSTLSEAAVQIIDGDRGANYPSSDDFSSSGYCLFLNAGNVTKDGFKFDDVAFITEEKDALLRKGKISRGDLVLTTRGSVGNAALYNNDIYFENIRINSGMVIIRTQKKISPDFLYEYFKSNFFSTWLSKVAFGSAQPQLSVKIINELSIYFPESSEQSRIGNFLFAVDKKIALLDKQHKLLRQYKKGMMQNIFTQELRFKDDSGDEFSDWEEVELKKIASKVNTKNRDNSVSTVLTNSATQGIVSQESYFEREIVTESNLTGYYVVRVGDFVYNPRISSTAPVGPIKMNELTQGVMSPLYTVFRFEKGLLKFYQYFFESSVWHDYMKSVANSGARHDRMNISGADFFDLPVPHPSDEEQTKIARFLSTIDDKITTKKAELDKLKTWKQGLSQQMFV